MKGFLVALLSLAGACFTLAADKPTTTISTTDGETIAATTLQVHKDPIRLDWQGTSAQSDDKKGSLGIDQIMSVQFAAQAAKTTPQQFARNIYHGSWQMPDKFTKDVKTLGTSSVSRFEVSRVESSQKDAKTKETTACFTATLHIPVSATWTLEAIAPDRLGLTIDGKTVITPDTPDATATIELEAGARKLALSVPSSKQRIYEVKISGPGHQGDLAELLVGGAPVWKVESRNGSRLSGTGSKISDTSFTLKTAAGDLPIDWNAIRACSLNSPEVDKRLAALSDDKDVFLVANRDRLVELQASLSKIDAGHVYVDHNGTERKIAHARVAAFKRAKSGDPQPQAAATVHLADKSVIGGTLLGISNAGAITMTAPWAGEAPILIKAGLPELLLLRSPNCVFLSDLEPSSVKQNAWFDYPIAWRRDQGFAHEKPSAAGRQFGHALALHAYTRLHFSAPEAPSRFLATVGIESDAPADASASVRIMSGDQILATTKALTPKSKLWHLDIPLPTHREISLEVDFGDNDDIGDRVIFGDARFLTSSQEDTETKTAP